VDRYSCYHRQKLLSFSLKAFEVGLKGAIEMAAYNLDIETILVAMENESLTLSVEPSGSSKKSPVRGKVTGLIEPIVINDRFPPYKALLRTGTASPPSSVSSSKIRTREAKLRTLIHGRSGNRLLFTKLGNNDSLIGSSQPMNQSLRPAGRPPNRNSSPLQAYAQGDKIFHPATDYALMSEIVVFSHHFIPERL
jgi:hypothetical protein